MYTACSTDGMAKLWDCGRSQCLDTLIKADCAINACNIDIADAAINLDHRTTSLSNKVKLSMRSLNLIITIYCVMSG